MVGLTRDRIALLIRTRAAWKMMSPLDVDARVRLTAFEWLTEQSQLNEGVFTRECLEEGFLFEGNQVRLVGPQGIFKPRILPEAPLSITTTTHRPYSDSFGPDDLLRYSYRGTDPMHHENVGLRKAMARRLPLVYFHSLLPGKYVAAWPVFIRADDPSRLTFTVEVDDSARIDTYLAETLAGRATSEPSDARRRYVTAVFRRRLHQQAFRQRVLWAYREQCALCRLRHEELLDAAHIVPDADPEGEPVVQNGLALCKLHHAAFDRFFLTVRSDYVIEVRKDVLDEEDGPVLLHALKGMHQQKILLPRSSELYPDPRRLEVRYQRFKKAC